MEFCGSFAVGCLGGRVPMSPGEANPTHDLQYPTSHHGLPATQPGVEYCHDTSFARVILWLL